MPKPIVHVLFTPSAAGTLRQVLKQAGTRQKVLCAFDDFSVGPIGRNNAERIAWIEEELGIMDWTSVVADTQSFLRESCSGDAMPVVWISRLDSRTQAGFHWWLSRLGDAPCKVIDIALDPSHAPISSASLLPEEMAQLLGSGVDLSLGERKTCQNHWRQLVVENAPFRVVTPDGSLASAPITFFDPLLLSCVTSEWAHPAWIVRRALATMAQGYRQTSDLTLFARLDALVKNDQLEWRDRKSVV